MTFGVAAASEKLLAKQHGLAKSKESVTSAASATAAAAEATFAKNAAAAPTPAEPTLSPREQIMTDLKVAQTELKWRGHQEDATKALAKKMEEKAADLAETQRKMGMPQIQAGKVDTAGCVNIVEGCDVKANAGQCATDSLTATQCPKSCDTWAAGHGLAQKYCTRVVEAQQKNKSANTVPRAKPKDGLLQFMSVNRWYFVGCALALLAAGMVRAAPKAKARFGLGGKALQDSLSGDAGQ